MHPTNAKNLVPATAAVSRRDSRVAARRRQAARGVTVAALFATAVVGLGLPVAQADGLPRLDVAKACRSNSGSVTPEDKTAGRDPFKACLESEDRVRRQIAANWARYSAASRAQCAQDMRGAYHATYVEMISCLEMANPAMMRTTPAQ